MNEDDSYAKGRLAIFKWLLGCLIGCTVLFLSPSISIAAENSFINGIQERGYIRVGLPPYNTPPAYYIDPKTNELSGYDVDFAKKLAEELEVDVKFDRKSEDFNDLVRRVGANEFDLAMGKLGTTYSRLFDAFPVQYMQLRHGILANRQALEKNDLRTALPNFGDKLKNSSIRIGAMGGSIWDTEVRRVFPNAKIKKYKGWPKVKEALFEGEVDAIYRDATEIKAIVYEDPNLAIQYAPILFEDELTMTSIFMNESGKIGFDDFLRYFIDREWGEIKNDSEIIEEFQDYYNSLSNFQS